MKHAMEAMLVNGLASGITAMPWSRSLGLGSLLGDVAWSLGLRRKVAENNLTLAFPHLAVEERARILVEHYRELGRVACEYPRMGELVRAPASAVVAELEGFEHLETARVAGRGAILMTGHFGNFELLGAWLGRMHPVSFVIKPLSNPRVDRLVTGWRRAAGVDLIPLGTGVRRVFTALKENHWVAMLADQDARHDGVFVPFMGRPASTPVGPAELSIRTRAPIVMGFVVRRHDGRHTLTLTPPIEPPAPGTPDAVRVLTAAHTAVLEQWVRRYPQMWFWLHRRWKTRPSGEPEKGRG